MSFLTDCSLADGSLSVVSHDDGCRRMSGARGLLSIIMVAPADSKLVRRVNAFDERQEGRVRETLLPLAVHNNNNEVVVLLGVVHCRAAVCVWCVRVCVRACVRACVCACMFRGKVRSCSLCVLGEAV